MDDPRSMLPKTESVEPTLPILHTDRELLMREQHRREREEPKVEKPTRESEAPTRAKLRTEMDDPKCISPITDNAKTEPSLEIPTRDTVEPMLEKLRTERDEPRVA